VLDQLRGVRENSMDSAAAHAAGAASEAKVADKQGLSHLE
jgi:hypothetical protein